MIIQKFFKIIILSIFFKLSFFSYCLAASNKIVAKVGNEIISSIDIENEILTILIGYVYNILSNVSNSISDEMSHVYLY